MNDRERVALEGLFGALTPLSAAPRYLSWARATFDLLSACEVLEQDLFPVAWWLSRDKPSQRKLQAQLDVLFSHERDACTLSALAMVSGCICCVCTELLEHGGGREVFDEFLADGEHCQALQGMVYSAANESSDIGTFRAALGSRERDQSAANISRFARDCRKDARARSATVPGTTHTAPGTTHTAHGLAAKPPQLQMDSRHLHPRLERPQARGQRQQGQEHAYKDRAGRGETGARAGADTSMVGGERRQRAAEAGNSCAPTTGGNGKHREKLHDHTNASFHHKDPAKETRTASRPPSPIRPMVVAGERLPSPPPPQSLWDRGKAMGKAMLFGSPRQDTEQVQRMTKRVSWQCRSQQCTAWNGPALDKCKKCAGQRPA
jgi:hypothetical protein